MLSEKVVRIDTEQVKVHEKIQMFLRKKGLKSNETMISYERDIKDFFNIIKDKQINQLTIEDLQLTQEDFDRFILECVDSEKYANATINRKVQAMKSLLKYLHSLKRNVNGKQVSLIEDVAFLDTKQIERLPEMTEEYGVLTVDEVMQMANLALTTEREKKEIKYYLILLALDTKFRKAALLNLKWTNFDVREDCVVVKIFDKGKKEYKTKISSDFYKELLKIKGDGDYVFDIEVKAVDRMTQRLIKKLNLCKERNLVFHSIRKAGIMFHYKVTSDALSTMKAANHSNFQTTTRYLENEDYGAIGAVSSQNLDMNIIHNLSEEQYKELIKSLNKDMALILAIKANELFNK